MIVAMPAVCTRVLAVGVYVLATSAGIVSAEPRLRNLVYRPARVSLAPGETHRVRVFGVYDDQSTRDLTAEVTFESKDTRVVEVLGSTIRARLGGDTVIEAKHSRTGTTADEPLRVNVAEIESLTIVPAKMSLARGQTAQLRALATLRNGRRGIDASLLVEWTSSQPDVASVFAGLVTANGAGTAKVEVMDRLSGARSSNDSGLVQVTERAERTNEQRRDSSAGPMQASIGR